MQFSPDTIAVLKNFASINQGLMFRKGTKKGSQLRTVSAENVILAEAKITDHIPQDFAVHDLNEFLNVVSLFKAPEFEFGNDAFVKITSGEGKSSVKYFYAHESMIVTPPEDMSKVQSAIEGAEIKFVMSEDDWNAVSKAASVLGSKYIGVQSTDGKTIELVALDLENASSNSYSVEVAPGNGDVFKMVFRTEHLKLMKGSYDIAISSQEISSFKNLDLDLTYFVSLEEQSNYGS
jgi:Straboviridae DNA polymerase processivity component